MAIEFQKINPDIIEKIENLLKELDIADRVSVQRYYSYLPPDHTVPIAKETILIKYRGSELILVPSDWKTEEPMICKWLMEASQVKDSEIKEELEMFNSSYITYEIK